MPEKATAGHAHASAAGPCPNCETLEQRVAELEKDKERLDWLDLHREGYGTGWICRLSENGRGWRLHETTRDGAFYTVREAIDAAKGEG